MAHPVLLLIWQSILPAFSHINARVVLSLSLIRFNIPLDTIIGHTGDESFLTINYTGTDDEKVTN